MEDGRVHEVPIVFAFDQGYANATAVAIASVIRHTSVDLDIHCICNELPPEEHTALLRAIRCTKSKLTVHPAPSLFASWKIAHHFTAAMYYRLMIPEIIDCNKALYLDSDIIVTCDIKPLLDIQLKDSWIGGCFDTIGSHETGLPSFVKETYINSGVMLLNLNAMREAKFRQRCEETFERLSNEIVFGDQCTINMVAYGKKTLIDPRWNVYVGSAFRENPGLFLEQILGPQVGQSIIHGCGAMKPWMDWCDPWLIKLWFKYAKLVFDDPVSLVTRTTTLGEHDKAFWIVLHQQRWSKALEILDVMLEFYKARLGEISSFTIFPSDVEFKQLEEQQRWEEAVQAKIQVVIRYRERYEELKQVGMAA